MAMNPLEIKQIGPYPVRRYLRAGGMAWVFEVQDPRFTDHMVVRALKMLKPEAAAGEEFLRFQREAGLLAEIDHPHLISIFDFGRDEATGCFYYTMTYVDGQEDVDGPAMSDYIAKYGRVGIEDACRIFAETLSALAELHDRGIIHRDIKPGNILIHSDGRARLADLGIARIEEPRDGHATRTGTAIGTVLYMSPEQARGRPVGPPSDIFSVGLTFFQALTGEIVYDRIEDLDSTSQQDILGFLVSLARTGETLELDFPAALQIPRELQRVLQKSVQYRAEDRYPDARAMAAALDKAVHDLYGQQAGAGRAISRWPLVAALGTIVLAAAGTGGYFAYEIWKEQGAVERLVSEIEPLRIDASASLQRAKDLNGVVDGDVLATVEQTISRAEMRWDNAQEDIQAKNWDSAETALGKAQEQFLAACAKLSEAGVTGRAENAMAGLTTQLEGLRRIYGEVERRGEASEGVKRTWGEIQTRMEELDLPPPADTCTACTDSLDQIDGSGAVLALVRDIETELPNIGGRMADEARARAQQASRSADSDRIDAQAYRSEMTAGWELFASGDAETDPWKRRDLFDQATGRFESAGKVVPAFEARERVASLEQQMRGKEIGVRTSLVRSKADTAYAARSWPEAANLYNEVEKLILDDLNDADRRAQSEQRLSAAREEKQRAEKGDADRIAQAEFERAESALAEGEAALEQGDFKQASERLTTAATLYEDALAAAKGALATAEEEKRKAYALQSEALGRSDCSRIEPLSARGTCEAAFNALARGDTALQAKDPRSALQFYTDASASIRRTKQLIDSRPQPPVITARSPKREEVEIFRGSPLRLDVSVQDPNENERLEYSWSFDGSSRAGAGRTLDFTPDKPGRAVVTVTDATGNRVETTWNIRFKNRPPELRVTPEGAIKLKRGGTQRFTASASDPDGTKLATEFKLDGARVGEADSYTFEASKPGTYELAVVTRDADGGVAKEVRKITVTNLAPSLKVEPLRGPEIERGNTVQFSASVSDPEGTAVTTRWNLDGAPVGKGRSYAFAKNEPGTYTLEIVARDVDGATASATRTISVLPGNVFPPADTEWKREVFDTIKRYEAALESKDMRELETVWGFRKPDPMRDIWRARFRKYDDIGIRLTIASAEKTHSDQVSVKFDQAESLDGRSRTWEIETTLLHRAAGWQIIKYDRKMKR